MHLIIMSALSLGYHWEMTFVVTCILNAPDYQNIIVHFKGNLFNRTVRGVMSISITLENLELFLFKSNLKQVFLVCNVIIKLFINIYFFK